MYKTISNEIIRQFNPCYDPSKVITDENEELTVKQWIEKYRKVIPANDILWLLLREEFLSEKDLRLFAVWCARESLKLIENPDERSVEACNVAEKYANGEAIQEELHTAHDAAHDAARAAFDAARAAFDAARAASDATRAASDATSDALVAARVAYYAHAAANAAARASDTAYNTVCYAANTAVYDVTRSSQLDQLLTYFE